MMKISPETVLRLISFWPPYLASGISVASYDLAKGEVVSKLRSLPINRNYFGTHFGGNLFSMCDPFHVFILSHHLGKGYYIWDKKTSIDFIKATALPVFAHCLVPPEKIQEIAALAAHGEKVEPEFEFVITTKDQEVIARVVKTLYVRKKNKARP
jgi:acyl-coenzyme A thioesterase PaaI-like protein